jgi:hypothetical protein
LIQVNNVQVQFGLSKKRSYTKLFAEALFEDRALTYIRPRRGFNCGRRGQTPAASSAPDRDEQQRSSRFTRQGEVDLGELLNWFLISSSLSRHFRLHAHPLCLMT